MPDKVRENRARRAAHRQGYKLLRSRRRDPRSVDYATYGVFDSETNSLVFDGGYGSGYGLSIEDVENFLADADKPAALRRASEQ